MITAIHGPLIYQPEQWVLVFDRKPANRWIGWLVWGEYKHVRAYGYVPFLHVWIFQTANLAGIEVWVAADGEPARAMIGQWTAGDTERMLMPRRPHANRSPFLALSGWCVPHVKRLIGLRSSALRPSSLFADCLRNGGRLYGNQRASPTGTCGGPNVRGAAATAVAAAVGPDHGSAAPGLHRASA